MTNINPPLARGVGASNWVKPQSEWSRTRQVGFSKRRGPREVVGRREKSRLVCRREVQSQHSDQVSRSTEQHLIEGW